MKTSIFMSLIIAAILSGPVAANAGDAAVKPLHGHHVVHRHVAFARATALAAPAPRSVSAQVSDPPRTDGYDRDGFSWEPSNW